MPQPNLCLRSAPGDARIAGKIEHDYNIPRMNHARFEQDCLRFLYSLGPPDRIGQLSPPRGVPWHDLHKVTGKGCSQSPFPGRHVESETRSQDLDAGLVRGRNLIECKRRIVQHSQLDIPARDKDAPLPIRVQGIRDSCTKEKSAFVHFFDDFSCFKLRLYSKSDRLQRKIYARPCCTCFRERQFYCARLRNDSTSHRSRLTPGRHPRRAISMEKRAPVSLLDLLAVRQSLVIAAQGQRVTHRQRSRQASGGLRC